MDGKQTNHTTISRDLTQLLTVELVTWGVMADGTVETQTVTFCNILSFTMKCGSCSKIFETLKLLRKHVKSNHSAKSLILNNRFKEESKAKEGMLSPPIAGVALSNISNAVNESIVKIEPTSDSEEMGESIGEVGKDNASVERGFDINDVDETVSEVSERGYEHGIANISSTIISSQYLANPSGIVPEHIANPSSIALQYMPEDGFNPLSLDTHIKSETSSEALMPVTTEVTPVTIIHKADAAKLKSTAGKIMKSTGTDITKLLSPSKKLRKNANSKHHPCPECGSILQSMYKLKIHMRIHTGEKPFLCSHVDEKSGTACGKAFSLKYNLQQHQWTHSKLEREKTLKCTMCDQTFWKMHRLKTHTRKHTGEKPYSCDVCGERFSLNSTLKCHKRVHTGEKPFECTICGSRFTVISSLRVHTRIHTGERPFPCDRCDQAFKSNSELRKHSVVHTGEKPHVCKECGKCFAMRVNYNSHIKVHSGDLYMCDVCGKSFKTTQSLTRCKRLHEEAFSEPTDVPLDPSSLLILDNLTYTGAVERVEYWRDQTGEEREGAAPTVPSIRQKSGCAEILKF